MTVTPWILVVVLLVSLGVSTKKIRDLSFKLTQEKDARQKIKCLLRKTAHGVELLGDDIQKVKNIHGKLVVLHMTQKAQICKLVGRAEGKRVEVEGERTCERE